MTQLDGIKKVVAEVYAARIEATSASCGDAECGDAAYPAGLIDGLPDGVVSYGCGNPTALASIRPGERVLDLGSGAGLDCFIAARQVGPEGWVVGVDFTQAMLVRARSNATALGLTNVEFREGDIEKLPLDDASVDVVISNCVVNLAPDKPAVFREAYRALAPGGRLMVSDIVLTRPATETEAADMALLTGCISGSLPVDDYLAAISAAGFLDVSASDETSARPGEFWYSAAVSARKPG